MPYLPVDPFRGLFSSFGAAQASQQQYMAAQQQSLTPFSQAVIIARQQQLSGVAGTLEDSQRHEQNLREIAANKRQAEKRSAEYHAKRLTERIEKHRAELLEVWAKVDARVALWWTISLSGVLFVLGFFIGRTM